MRGSLTATIRRSPQQSNGLPKLSTNNGGGRVGGPNDLVPVAPMCAARSQRSLRQLVRGGQKHSTTEGRRAA